MIAKIASLWRTRRAGDGGSAAEEFALVVPVLIVLVFGAADYGVMAYTQSEVVASARAGAQYALSNTEQASAGWTIPATLLPPGLPSGATSQFTPNPPSIVCACVTSTPVAPTAAACSATCASPGILVGYTQVNAQVNSYTAFLSRVVPFFGNFGIPSNLYGRATLRVP